MKKNIDCILIGHNAMDFMEYEKYVKTMGVNSGAYRDLNKNYVQYGGQYYTFPELYSLLGDDSQNLDMLETFSPTISYLGTFLNKHNFTFDFISSYQEQKEKLKELIINNKVLSVAISTTLYISANPIIEIVEDIREIDQDIKIIIGGHFVSTQVGTYDKNGLLSLFKLIGGDIYINSSQGEKTLVSVIKSFKNDEDLDHIPNIYYLKDHDIVVTGKEIENNLLDENVVDWSLFSGQVGPFAGVRTAISCPFACSFCGFPEHAGKYQTSKVASVEKELNSLKANTSAKHIHFIDDTFNIPKERFKEMLRMFIKND